MLIGLPNASGGHLQGLAHLDPKHHRYRKLYFSGRQLAGAVLIGDFRGWNELRGLVETKEPIVAPESLARVS
jgi:NAD(P)H-nitrite reductase large subunit